MSGDRESEHFREKKAQAFAQSLPEMWWSVDPGEVHVGIAVWMHDELNWAEEWTPKQLRGQLFDAQPSLIIIEAFSLRSPRWSNAQARQAVETIKLIGGVHALAELFGAVVVEQQPSVRATAQASPFWRDLQALNIVPANSHARSAVAHGVYYARFAKR
jgi:hypothetical protein